MDRIEAKKRVIEETRNAIKKAEELFNIDLSGVRIRFSNRMTKCAGLAYSDMQIAYSEPIMMDNFDSFIERTPYHEVAHLVEYRLFGKAGHKYPFQSIMTAMGKNPSRCHTYKTAETKKGNVYKYRCLTCGNILELGKIRHQRMRSGEKNYRHACDKGYLEYVGNDIIL